MNTWKERHCKIQKNDFAVIFAEKHVFLYLPRMTLKSIMKGFHVHDEPVYTYMTFRSSSLSLSHFLFPSLSLSLSLYRFLALSPSRPLALPPSRLLALLLFCSLALYLFLSLSFLFLLLSEILDLLDISAFYSVSVMSIRRSEWLARDVLSRDGRASLFRLFCVCANVSVHLYIAKAVAG